MERTIRVPSVRDAGHQGGRVTLALGVQGVSVPKPRKPASRTGGRSRAEGEKTCAPRRARRALSHAFDPQPGNLDGAHSLSSRPGSGGRRGRGPDCEACAGRPATAGSPAGSAEFASSAQESQESAQGGGYPRRGVAGRAHLPPRSTGGARPIPCGPIPCGPVPRDPLQPRFRIPPGRGRGRVGDRPTPAGAG